MHLPSQTSPSTPESLNYKHRRACPCSAHVSSEETVIVSVSFSKRAVTPNIGTTGETPTHLRSLRVSLKWTWRGSLARGEAHILDTQVPLRAPALILPHNLLKARFLWLPPRLFGT